MTKNEIIEKITSIKKGAFYRFEISTPQKTLAAHKTDNVNKYTKMVARFGIEYGKMKTHKDKIIGPLPWGEWVNGYEGYLIEHKGNTYLRFYSSAVKSMVNQYTLNGIVVDKQWLQDNGYISSAVKTPSDTFVVNINNIISMGA